MILFGGNVYPSAEQDALLDRLEAHINDTRAKKTLAADTVITALDTLSHKIEKGVFNDRIRALGIDGIDHYVRTAVLMLRRENLEYKLRTELGIDGLSPTVTAPPFAQESLRIRPMPLGTLLHIVAGNVDGLPAYSVAEGLVTGNVNILKLPQADNGLSIEILRSLLEIEPRLKEYVYAFDTPSADLAAIKKMADMADGIVIWGGNEALRAVRTFAPVGAKLIEWGHRLSFAYIAGYRDKEAELRGLATHILSTKQLLCSSCQTIFLDTDSMEEVTAFSREFLSVLEETAAQFPPLSIGEIAENTLRRYNDTLESCLSGECKPERGRTVFRGERCSVTACEDNALELSAMFGNCLVKRLPRRKIFSTLRAHKGVLQTVGLLCPDECRAELEDIFARCGITRITTAANMSALFSGEAHDGEYPLRRYVRVVNLEN